MKKLSNLSLALALAIIAAAPEDAGWLCVLAELPPVWLILTLGERRPPKSKVACVFGLLLSLCLFAAAVADLSSRMSVTLYAGVSPWAFAAALTLLSLWAVYDRQRVIRAAPIFFYFSAALILVLFAVSIPSQKFLAAGYMPTLKMPDFRITAAAIVCLFVKNTGRAGLRVGALIGFSGAAMIAVLCRAVLGERKTGLYAAAQTMMIPGFVERVDALSVSLWLMCDVSLITLAALAARDCLGKIKNSVRFT